MEKMNILIINGSPRKKGLISQMLGIMQSEAEQRSDKVALEYLIQAVTWCHPCHA